jgi:DNA-binding MarR family transcriptional regulator
MDTELIARLRAVIHRLARVLNDTSTGEGLTPTQYSVLALVRSRGPLGLTELNELGLVRRMPDPGDLRAARLAATAEGERVHDRVRAERTRVVSDCLHALPPETAKMLLSAVPDLEALAEALKSPPKPAKGDPRSARTPTPPGATSRSRLPSSDGRAPEQFRSPG